MEIKIKVEFERLDDILAAMNNFSTVLASLNAPAAQEVKEAEAPKKRTRKAKAATAEESVSGEPQYASVVEDHPETPSPVEDRPETPSPAEEEIPPFDEPVTKEVLQHACIDAAKRVGKEKTMAAIKSLGYSGLSQVPEDKYRKLYVTLQGLQ